MTESALEYLPKAPSPNTATGVGLQHMSFEGTQTFSPSQKVYVGKRKTGKMSTIPAGEHLGSPG